MTTFLHFYLTLNILVILLCIFSWMMNSLGANQKLKILYLGLTVSLLFLFLQPYLPKSNIYQPVFKVWDGTTTQSINWGKGHTNKHFISLQNDNNRIEVSTVNIGLISFVSLILFFTLFKYLKEIWLLRKISKNSVLIKKRGNIIVYTNDSILIPFSMWFPGRFNTFIPTSLLSDSSFFQNALAHEFQHHRQGDTQWIFGVMLLKYFCFFNPFAHWLEKDIQETQEFACDENLLLKKKIDSESYIGCLVKVAQTSVIAKNELGCATGFCFKRGHHILKRRVHMLITPKIKQNNILYFIFSLFLTSSIGFTVWASKNLVQDRRITMEEAQDLIRDPSEFPLVVNQEVLKQLNRFVGTPEGRTFFKEALKRKKSYASILSESTQQYKTPVELNAIPIVESGYKNIISSYSLKAAGLWMFIPSTARRFGMRVTASVDERLDVVKETDAAQKYLVDNKNLFNDWLLSVLAYNMGEGAVARGIKKYRTRDAWELIENGVEGDRDYLPRVVAAMIIMKNPKLLD